MATFTKQAAKSAPIELSSDFKAVILYTVIRDWTPDDTLVSDEAVNRMKRGLGAVGMDVTPVAIRSDIYGPLKQLDPREHVIFNWCEGFDANGNDYEAVPLVRDE